MVYIRFHYLCLFKKLGRGYLCVGDDWLILCIFNSQRNYQTVLRIDGTALHSH